jgi:hypothetical protein
MSPGQEWLRVAIERLFVDTIPDQHKGLEQVLRVFRRAAEAARSALEEAIPPARIAGLW